MNSSPGALLRRAVRALLPHAVLRRIADYRFGYSDEGRRFDVAIRPSGDIHDVTIDSRLQLRVTTPFLEDLRFHFVSNGQSRDEIGAFIDISSALPPDALLLDVGAHRGLFALVHCALGARREAVLLEPSRSLSEDARRLLDMNGFGPRTTVRACGAGDRAGSRTIVEDGLGFARISDADGGTATEFVTLDDEWRRIGRDPAIVKIDVEGFEAEVLRGARELLRSVKPVLFLELHLDELKQRSERVGPIVDALCDYGYRFREPGGVPLTPHGITRSFRAIIRLIAESAG